MIPPIALLVLAVSALVQSTRPSGPLKAATVDHSRWDALLKQVVRDEKVDYVAVRDRHRGELRAYLDALAEVDPSSLPRAEQLALYLNLYNAATIDLVVDRYRPDYSPAEAKGAIWDEQRVRLGGTTISLNTLEHQIIRKQIVEPRAHAALVCAALSCPALSPDAYTGDRLERQLDDAMPRWINDPKRNVIDRGNRRLRLSKIFRWYADDFGGLDRLSAYVARYTDADVAGFEVTFLQYDWRLNDLSELGRP